jgi:hypothetical protein
VGRLSGFGGVPLEARSAVSVACLESASLEASSLRMSSCASMNVGNFSRSGSIVLKTLNLGFRPWIN